MTTYFGNMERNKKYKLKKCSLYIIEQSNDNRKFNRGMLLNIGIDIANRNGNNIFITHDVDLLPDQILFKWYCKWPSRPIHIARRWDRYSTNRNYFGGIVSFNYTDLCKMNGYPNNFWGWGGEDDELMIRLKDNIIPEKKSYYDYPKEGDINDLEDMDINTKIRLLKKHPEWKEMTKWEKLDEHDKNWKINGLSNLKYLILSKQQVKEYIFKIKVELYSDI